MILKSATFFYGTYTKTSREVDAISFHRPFIIDVEASGFGRSSYPIEVGVALAENERYCCLITPCSDWIHWDEKAQAVHHISRRLLLNSGKQVHEVAMELNRLLGNATVYSDGWVVDKPWLTRLFSRAGMAPTFRISPLEMILTEAQMAIWHSVKEIVICESSFTRHRASTDAFIVQETWVRTREQVRAGKPV